MRRGFCPKVLSDIICENRGLKLVKGKLYIQSG